MSPLYTPPGGWQITTRTAADSMSAWQLATGWIELSIIMGGALYTLLRGSGVSAGQVQRALEIAWSNNKPGLDISSRGAYTFFTALFQPSAYVITATVHALANVVDAVWGVQNNIVPAAQNAAQDFAFNYTNAIASDIYTGMNQTLQRANDYTNTKIAGESAYIAAVENGIVTWTQRNIDIIYHDFERTDARITANSAARANQSNNYAHAIGMDLATYTTQGLDRVTSELQATQQWAATEIADTRAQAATDAATAANQAIANANAATQAQLQPVWAGTAESANQTIPQLKTETPTANKTLSPVSVITPLTPALALAGIVKMIKPLTNVANECSIPYCKEKNTLGKTTHTLDSLIGTGLLGAFIVEMIKSPTTVANDVATVATDVAKPFETIFLSLVG